MRNLVIVMTLPMDLWAIDPSDRIFQKLNNEYTDVISMALDFADITNYTLDEMDL